MGVWSTPYCGRVRGPPPGCDRDAGGLRSGSFADAGPAGGKGDRASEIEARGLGDGCAEVCEVSGRVPGWVALVCLDLPWIVGGLHRAMGVECGFWEGEGGG